MSEIKKEQTKHEYLQEIVDELLADEEWALPKELRFWLMGTYTWKLLYFYYTLKNKKASAHPFR